MRAPGGKPLPERSERRRLGKKRLGRTAIEVTELGFGAAPIGNLYAEVAEKVALEAVEAAWRNGIRYFDTAPHYGLGLSERRLGEVLAGHPRRDFVVSTKVGRLLLANDRPAGSDLNIGGFAVPDSLRRVRDFSADGVRRSLEASLARLGLDSVDIVLVHDPDDFVEQAITEAIPALIELRDQGVVGAVGIGMNQWHVPVRAVHQTDLDVVMLAGRWTLLDRSGRQLLDLCAQRSVAVLAAGPFNSGLLARPWPADDSSFEYAIASTGQLARARALARLSSDLGATLPQLALQYPLRHPAVVSVVAGMRSADEVTANIRSLETAVDPDLWPAIEGDASPPRSMIRAQISAKPMRVAACRRLR